MINSPISTAGVHCPLEHGYKGRLGGMRPSVSCKRKRKYRRLTAEVLPVDERFKLYDSELFPTCKVSIRDSLKERSAEEVHGDRAKMNRNRV